MDKKKKLNARQKKFCILRASGMSQIEAHKKAGFIGKYNSASNLEKKVNITEEICRLQTKREDNLFNLAEECKKYDPKLIARLAEISLKGEPEARNVVSAIKELLDRGHGKATQSITLSDFQLICHYPDGRTEKV